MITLATLEQATEQEVFDQAVNHMLTQNEKCLNKDGKCSYKNENGLKCVGGSFISEEEYKPIFENVSWTGLSSMYGITNKHQELIYQLQIIHDNKLVVEWKDSLKEFATQYNLIFNHN